MENFKLIMPFSKYPTEESRALTYCQDAQTIKAQVDKQYDFSDFGLYKNDKYTVTVYPVNGTDISIPPTVYIKIRDHEWSTRHDWRDFQEIKNKMFGPECEGLEVYPPESLLQDTANCYWMVVFVDPAYRSFFTLRHRRMVMADDGNPHTKQRSFANVEVVKVPKKIMKKMKSKSNNNFQRKTRRHNRNNNKFLTI